jgi:hypothetical protein
VAVAAEVAAEAAVVAVVVEGEAEASGGGGGPLVCAVAADTAPYFVSEMKGKFEMRRDIDWSGHNNATAPAFGQHDCNFDGSRLLSDGSGYRVKDRVTITCAARVMGVHLTLARLPGADNEVACRLTTTVKGADPITIKWSRESVAIRSPGDRFIESIALEALRGLFRIVTCFFLIAPEAAPDPGVAVTVPLHEKLIQLLAATLSVRALSVSKTTVIGLTTK